MRVWAHMWQLKEWKRKKTIVSKMSERICMYMLAVISGMEKLKKLISFWYEILPANWEFIAHFSKKARMWWVEKLANVDSQEIRSIFRPSNRSFVTRKMSRWRFCTCEPFTLISRLFFVSSCKWNDRHPRLRYAQSNCCCVQKKFHHTQKVLIANGKEFWWSCLKTTVAKAQTFSDVRSEFYEFFPSRSSFGS